jgi:hypothetical protein
MVPFFFGTNFYGTSMAALFFVAKIFVHPVTHFFSAEIFMQPAGIKSFKKT